MVASCNLVPRAFPFKVGGEKGKVLGKRLGKLTNWLFPKCDREVELGPTVASGWGFELDFKKFKTPFSVDRLEKAFLVFSFR